MNRRTFIKGMVAVVALSIVPMQMKAQPHLNLIYMSEGDILLSKHIPSHTAIIMANRCKVLDCYFERGSVLDTRGLGAYTVIGNYFDIGASFIRDNVTYGNNFDGIYLYS